MGCAVAGARTRAGFAVSFSSLSCLPVSTQKGNRACETPVTLCVDWGSGEEVRGREGLVRAGGHTSTSYLAVVGRPLWSWNCALEMLIPATSFSASCLHWGWGCHFCVTAAVAPPVGTSLPSLLRASTRRGIA